MLFLMKLLFGFCLDFLLPKKLDNTGSNLEITKKKYGNTEKGRGNKCFEPSVVSHNYIILCPPQGTTAQNRLQ